LVRGTDPRIRILIKMSRFHNTGSNLPISLLQSSNPTDSKVSFVFGCMFRTRSWGNIQRSVVVPVIYGTVADKVLDSHHFDSHLDSHPNQIIIRIKVNRIRISLQMTNQNVRNIGLYEHSFKGLSLYLVARNLIRIRIRVKSRIRIRTHRPHQIKIRIRIRIRRSVKSGSASGSAST
jgi:hypothetical protein